MAKTYHKGYYFLNFKRGFEDYKKQVTISIDKVYDKDSLTILLSDDQDPTFLCMINLTRSDYEDLKKQQGLLIEFDDFPSQLVRLLQQCAANNMFLILQQSNPIMYLFEIVEHNEFKRLVHLSLKTGPATDNDIKKHMAETIKCLNRKLDSLKNSSSSNEIIWKDKFVNMEQNIEELKFALSKMEEDKIRRECEYQETLKKEREKLAQEKQQFTKHIESNFNAQTANTHEILNRKDKYIEELNSNCKQLKENILCLESQLSEKSQRINFLEAEVQKLHIEVSTLKSKNTSLDRENMEKEKRLHHLNLDNMHLEKTVKDKQDAIKDLNNSLQIIKKEKASLEDRLTLSESLVGKNNEALQSTSEQLMKANQIITKQNTDLIEMKEKLLCRTAIALEQEKVIDSNTKELEKLRMEIISTKKTFEEMKNELENVKKKYDSTEKALQDRDETIRNNNMVIQWLHKKIDNILPTDMSQAKNGSPTTGASSTPYMGSKNSHNITQETSDESINFYATSKVHDIEESQQPHQEKFTKSGLDPKYLKPVEENMQSKIRKKIIKSSDLNIQKGKENVNINLPNVDYREKKSSRGNTYRATPVSAYFP